MNIIICPKCKCEYRKGFKICADCNVELVEEIEDYENEEENFIYDDLECEWVLLKNVSDGFESDTIIPLLKSNDIQVLEKQRESGQYIKIAYGKSYFGTDIYVPKYQLNEAKEIIKFLDINTMDNESKREISSYEYEKKSRLMKWYFLLAVIVPFIIFILVSIFNTLSRFFEMLNR